MTKIIDRESAKNLIDEYRQQNAADGGPALKTPAGQNLNGFFIDRQSLETILSNPKAMGLSLHLAKHPDFAGAPGNYFTAFLAGAEPNTAANATTPYVNTGDIYGNLPPCPPDCGTIG